MEAESSIYKLLLGLSLGLGAFFIFLWAALSGMFRDSEDVKYRVYRKEMEESPFEEGEDER